MLSPQWQPDGALIHRYPARGSRVAVLPGRCRCGAHALAEVGYRARYVDLMRLGLRAAPGEMLEVSCDACQVAQRPGHAWWLRADDGPHAEAVELDDGPYALLREPLLPIPGQRQAPGGEAG